MPRDIRERLLTFIGGKYFCIEVVALLTKQTEGLPPNPAKVTDSRAKGYIKKFGHQSWELDALEPSTIVRLIENNLDVLREDDKWVERLQKKEEEKAVLLKMAKEYLGGEYIDI